MAFMWSIPCLPLRDKIYPNPLLFFFFWFMTWTTNYVMYIHIFFVHKHNTVEKYICMYFDI